MNTSACRTTFLTLVSVALILCASTVFAQQKDGEETNNTATPSGRVNFNIIQADLNTKRAAGVTAILNLMSLTATGTDTYSHEHHHHP